MFQSGCCIPGHSFMPEGVGEISVSAYEVLKTGTRIIMDNGFDFAEATVGLIMGLGEEELELLAGREGKHITVCNSFIPPSLPIVRGGDDLRKYVNESMRRMKVLSIDTVIFGSGTARRIPEGMSKEEGMEKITDFLKMCSEYGDKYGITVAIEPLNSRETNAINSVEEGAELAEKLKLKNIKLLADAFHMAREKEPVSILSDIAHLLVHVHVSEPDRAYPGKHSGDYLPAFAKELKAGRYKGGISAECSFDDFKSESAAAAAYMREVFK